MQLKSEILYSSLQKLKEKNLFLHTLLSKWLLSNKKPKYTKSSSKSANHVETKAKSHIKYCTLKKSNIFILFTGVQKSSYTNRNQK